MESPFDRRNDEQWCRLFNKYLADAGPVLSRHERRVSETLEQLDRPQPRMAIRATDEPVVCDSDQDNFKSELRIIHTFERLDNVIVRAGMIRCQTLLAEGGVYSDMDTDCTGRNSRTCSAKSPQEDQLSCPTARESRCLRKIRSCRTSKSDSNHTKMPLLPHPDLSLAKPQAAEEHARLKSFHVLIHFLVDHMLFHRA